MTVALSHQTALEYLRAYPCADNKERIALPFFPRCGTCGVTQEVVMEAQRRLPATTGCMHLFVSNENERHARPGVVWHKARKGIPQKSFLLIHGLYCVCPELLFLQMASELSFGSLVELGFSLCGDYGAGSRLHFDSLSNALTTPNALQSYLNCCNRIKGLEKAKAAAKYVLAGSASPRESKLAIMLILPKRLGGYGLPFPQMNTEIGSTGRFGDLVWPRQKVILEYDSSAFHGTAEADERDSIRRVEADLAGYSVITVKRPQLNDRLLFDDVARDLKRKLGIKNRALTASEIERQYALRKELDL